MYLTTFLSDLWWNGCIIFILQWDLIYLNLPITFAVRPNIIGYETVKLMRNEKWSWIDSFTAGQKI